MPVIICYALIVHTIMDFMLPEGGRLTSFSQKGHTIKNSLLPYIKQYIFYTLFCLPLVLLTLSLKTILILSLIRISVHLIMNLTLRLADSKNFTYYNALKLILFIAGQLCIITATIFTIFTTRFTSEAFLNELSYFNNTFKYLFLISYIALSGTYFVPMVLDIIYSKIDNYCEKLGRRQVVENDKDYEFVSKVAVGKWIGLLERALITYLVLINQLGIIGFVLAVKSLTRFKMLDDKIFAEYYLLGTLLSVVYTFLAFTVLDKILFF